MAATVPDRGPRIQQVESRCQAKMKGQLSNLPQMVAEHPNVAIAQVLT